MSDKLREALKLALDACEDSAPGDAAQILRTALADDDAARRTMREEFEAWIRRDCGDLTMFGNPPNQHYKNSAVNNAWLGWQAATRAAAPHQPRYRCASCSAPLKAGYACACGSDEAEEVEAAAPQSAELVVGAVWHEGSVSLIRRGSEDDYCKRHPGATRIYHRPQQAAPTEADRLDAVLTALRRLWPLFDKATKGYVFTTQRAGEVAADMEMLRAAMSAQAGGKEQGS